MTKLSRSVLIFFLLSAPTKAVASEMEATIIFENAKNKISRLSSYAFEYKTNSILYPAESGVTSMLETTAEGAFVFKKYDSFSKGKKSQKSIDKLYGLNFYPFRKKSKGITIWNGEDIYIYGNYIDPVKMSDCEEGRSLFFFQSFYNSLLKQGREKSKYVGGELVNNRKCYMIETQAGYLEQILGIDGKTIIAIDSKNGFPVKIICNKGKSKIVFEFKNYEINKCINNSIFLPPPNVKFEFIKGPNEFREIERSIEIEADVTV